MKLKPLGDRIVIKSQDVEKTTSGGIILTNTANQTSDKGTVVAAGPGRYMPDGSFRASEFSEGDVVLFVKGTGSEIKLDDETFTVLDGSLVIGIIKE
jgi:chaperonin GroES